ncbi:MAG: amidohydrolase family protein [Verrucomicrobia bacterium]|nr:amidohydrolase family protein [Verrucomicrobiota bacterium]
MLSRWTRLPFLACSLISLFSANLALGSEEAGNVIVLSGARLLDGTGRPPLEESVLVIIGDKINAVGAPNTVKYPADAKVIDCSGKTIVPGLISDHSHVGLVDGVSIKPENYNRENILRQLRQYERYGVTSVMALGLNSDLFYQLRDEQHAGKNPGADLFGADRGIGAPLGAPSAATIPVGNDQLYRPQTPEEAQAAVRDMAARHPDLIKIWVDDLLGTAPKIKPEIYRAAIQAAHGAGLRVACHIYYLDDAKTVIQAGADIIAHGVRDQPVDAQFVGLMKSASVWYIATLSLDESFYIYAEQPEWTKSAFFQAALQPALQQLLNDPSYLQKMRTNPRLPIFKKAVATNQANLKKLYDAGVQIGFGTDSGAVPLRIPGFAEHRELQLMVASGLSPAQALECATGHAAALLGLKDRGTLEAGKLADFIILDANPLQDITNTEKISAVWHRGKEVSGAITASP